MKDPFKSFVVFVIVILLIALLGSCTSSHKGYNYASHHKKSTKLMNKTIRQNKGHSLTTHVCTNKRK